MRNLVLLERKEHQNTKGISRLNILDLSTHLIVKCPVLKTDTIKNFKRFYRQLMIGKNERHFRIATGE